jgi:TolB-like protein/Tfp pilus assembly protein PilF
LPFKSLQANSGDEYLGLGLADTLITKLGGLRQLIVRPTSAIRKYSNAEQDPLAAGREQQVQTVLDANLQRMGEKVRVTVRLLNVSNGATLWDYQCDEEYCADLFLMQDRIAEKVGAALLSELTSAESKRLRKHYTENREAHLLYFKGRYFAEKRTNESLQMAEGFYKQALDLDPTYALAWAGLSEIYYLGVGSHLQPGDPRAKAAAEKALVIDETLSEAHTSLGRILWQDDWNWMAAERELKRAIELDSNNAFAHRIYGHYLASMGRPDQALSERKLVQQLDPLSPIINTELGWELYVTGHIDQAVAQSRKALEMDLNFVESHHALSRVLALSGRYAEAIAVSEKALPLSERHELTTKRSLGYAYALWGKREDAIKKIEEVKELSQQRKISSVNIARAYTALGEKDEAFEWLRKGCQERDRYMVFLNAWPEFKPLHSDPRFAEIIRCVGLPQ